MTKTNDTSKLRIDDVEAFTRRGGRAMRYAISSSPRMVIIACVGTLLATTPAWSATSWFASGKLTSLIRHKCDHVCSLHGGKTPVTSVTSKGTTYFVCRAPSGPESNRPGYQRSTYPDDRRCRVDHQLAPQTDAPFDCLCQ
jgi:hypothetical protein